MNILFIHHALTIGGIETLIAKLTSALKQQGHNTTLITELGGDAGLRQQVSQNATVIEVRSLYGLLLRYRQLRHLQVDVIYCFGPLQMVIGLWLQQRLFTTARLCIGAYHPREYYSSKQTKPYLQRIIERLVKRIPDRNILFMNLSCQERHAQALQRDFRHAAVIPGPVAAQLFTQACTNRRSNKIVSIGRIVSFKRYHFAMIGVIEALQQQGLFYEYHVYGEGDEYAELCRVAQASPARDHLFIHGTLDYQRVAEILADAYLFVGMGMAVVEAAAVGVPALIAIESESRALTYGFFADHDSNNLGEQNATFAQYPIVEKIAYLNALTAEQYQELADRGRRNARLFAIDEIADAYSRFFAESVAFTIPELPIIMVELVMANILRLLRKRLGGIDPLKDRYVDHSLQ